jgi:uncharacterized tellurite resistance protein B-like protein
MDISDSKLKRVPSYIRLLVTSKQVDQLQVRDRFSQVAMILSSNPQLSNNEVREKLFLAGYPISNERVFQKTMARFRFRMKHNSALQATLKELNEFVMEKQEEKLELVCEKLVYVQMLESGGRADTSQISKFSALIEKQYPGVFDNGAVMAALLEQYEGIIFEANEHPEIYTDLTSIRRKEVIQMVNEYDDGEKFKVLYEVYAHETAHSEVVSRSELKDNDNDDPETQSILVDVEQLLKEACTLFEDFESDLEEEDNQNEYEYEYEYEYE